MAAAATDEAGADDLALGEGEPDAEEEGLPLEDAPEDGRPAKRQRGAAKGVASTPTTGGRVSPGSAQTAVNPSESPPCGVIEAAWQEGARALSLAAPAWPEGQDGKKKRWSTLIIRFKSPHMPSLPGVL